MRATLDDLRLTKHEQQLLDWARREPDRGPEVPAVLTWTLRLWPLLYCMVLVLPFWITFGVSDVPTVVLILCLLAVFTFVNLAMQRSRRTVCSLIRKLTDRLVDLAGGHDHG